MQQTKKFKMADAISPYLAVSCGLTRYVHALHLLSCENIIHTCLHLITNLGLSNPRVTSMSANGTSNHGLEFANQAFAINDLCLLL